MAEDGLHTLLSQARAGDERSRERAFGELLRLLTVFVRAGMGRRLRDHRESDDVCQSIARSFIEDHGTGKVAFESEGALVAYLKTVVRSKLAMLARHDGALKRGADALGSVGGDLDGEPAACGEAACDGEVELRTREALALMHDRLSPDDQELTRLRLGGMEWAQIAQRLGREPAAVRKQWSRLVERVAAELES